MKLINPRKHYDELDVYDNGDNEQQTTCPKCGTRTWLVVDVAPLLQHHVCSECDYEFLLDITPPPECTCPSDYDSQGDHHPDCPSA